MTNTPRNIDHVVLPVPSLEIARERMTQLGFTVAPDARHEAGSENAIVFFENHTFIEPLAIGHRETVEAEMLERNTFLVRDAAFRFRHGDNGFSMVVMGEPDPAAARKAFKKMGYRTGKLVSVKRPGLDIVVSFVIDERSPDCTFFMCERPDGPPQFPADLTTHENGAQGINRVTLYEDVPSDFQYYLQDVMDQREVRSHSFGMDMEANNGTITTLNDDGLKAYYGVNSVPDLRGLRAFGFDITVGNLSAVKKLLAKNGVEHHKIGGRLIVPPATGQGATMAFVEA